MACALMGTYKLISIWFSPYTFTTISGVILSIGTLGNILATAPLALAVGLMGWRNAFLLIALVHLIITSLVYSIVNDYPDKSKGMGSPLLSKENLLKESVGGILSVVRLPSFWLIAISAFARYGTYVSIAGLWAGPYLEHVHQISLIDRGEFLMLFPLGFIIGGPIIGTLSDKVFKNRKFVAALAMSLYSICIFPLTGFFQKPSLLMLGVMFFFMGFLNSSSMIMYANIKELLPVAISGTAMSAVNFFTMAGAGFFQHVMGVIIEKFPPFKGQLPPGGLFLCVRAVFFCHCHRGNSIYVCERGACEIWNIACNGKNPKMPLITLHQKYIMMLIKRKFIGL